MATRIQARAIRRCGELLKEIETMQGKRTDLEPVEGDLPKSTTRKSAAEEAGLSEWQQKTAVRVANVPEEEFEAQRVSLRVGLPVRHSNALSKLCCWLQTWLL
jgi:hypothetical protein